MKRMLMSAITDGNSSKISTKRLVVMIMVLLLCAVIIGHVFFNKTVADYVYDGLIQAVIWSMGFIGSEKLAAAIPAFMNNRRSNSNKPPKPNDQLPSDDLEAN